MNTVPRRSVTSNQVALLRAYEQRDREWLRSNGLLRDDDTLTLQATLDLTHAQLVIYPDQEEQRVWAQAEQAAIEHGILT